MRVNSKYSLGGGGGGGGGNIVSKCTGLFCQNNILNFDVKYLILRIPTLSFWEIKKSKKNTFAFRIKESSLVNKTIQKLSHILINLKIKRHIHFYSIRKKLWCLNFP